MTISETEYGTPAFDADSLFNWLIAEQDEKPWADEDATRFSALSQADAREAIRRLHDLLVVRGMIPISVAEGKRLQLARVMAQSSTASDLDGAIGWLLINAAVESYQAEWLRHLKDCDDLCLSDYSREDAHVELSNRVNRLLESESVTTYLLSEYEVDRSALSADAPITFHRAGTTSLILRTTTSGNVSAALKVLKFAYIDNPNITAATRAYGSEMKGRGRERVPMPLCANGRRYILLPFKDGVTLREHAEDIVRKKQQAARQSALLDLALAAIKDVCCTLESYAKNGVWHHDLSPDNIILCATNAQALEGGHYEDVEFWVLDWGFNYLLSERVGASSAASLVRDYVDPQLLDGKQTDALGDLFSLGAILLELLSGRRLGIAERENGRIDAWTRAAPLAELVDTLTHDNPDMRAPWSPHTRGYRVFSGLVDQLELRFGMVVQDADSTWNNVLDAFDRIVQLGTGLAVSTLSSAFKRIGQVRGLGEKYRDTREYRDMAEQAAWMVGAQVVSTITGGLVFLSRAGELTRFGLHQASWSAFFICFSFTVVAANYYINIYSQISTWDLGRWGKIAMCTMRFNAFCFAPPILYAALWDSSAWPVCSALGVWFVALNNFVTLGLARRSRRRSDGNSDSSTAFIAYYGDWWWLMAVYGLALFLFWIFLGNGTLSDEPAYAALATAMNLKMLGTNVTKYAPYVKSNLSRLYADYRRALTIRRTPKQA